MVKNIHMMLGKLIILQDNFELIFDAVLVFFESFDTYTNFQNINLSHTLIISVYSLVIDSVHVHAW